MVIEDDLVDAWYGCPVRDMRDVLVVRMRDGKHDVMRDTNIVG